MATTAFARDVVLSDLVSEDCRDEFSIKAAKERLKDRKIKVGRGEKKIRELCEELKGMEGKEVIEIPEKARGLTGKEGLVAAISGEFSFCSHYKSLLNLAKRYDVSYRVAINTCFFEKRQALLASNSGDLSSRGLHELLGRQVDQILEEFDIQRNPYLTDLRMRFARSLRPGIDQQAPYPHKLLGTVEGYPWICIPNEPFSGPALSGSRSGSERKVISFSSPIGPRIEDDDQFVYGYNNGLELVGSDKDGHFLRSIRLEYFCLEEGRADCNENNYDQKILLIEESVKSNGLISRAFDWGTDLRTDAREVLHTYLEARGARAQSNYFLEDGRDCGGGSQLRGDCEIAVRYFECAAETTLRVKDVLSLRWPDQSKK